MLKCERICTFEGCTNQLPATAGEGRRFCANCVNKSKARYKPKFEFICANPKCTVVAFRTVGDKRKFCSLVCAARTNKQKQEEERLCSWKGCNKLFTVPLWNTQRYCSASCGTKGSFERMSPESSKERSAKLRAAMAKRQPNVCRTDPYKKYQFECKFRFNLARHPNVPGSDLVDKLGWFWWQNINGVAKDHMFSVWEGYKQGVSPDIISHPANCQILTHKDNAAKYTKCVITLPELEERIRTWPTEPTCHLEKL